MLATIVNELPPAMTPSAAVESQPSTAQIASIGGPQQPTAEIKSAECACCGLTEECTLGYIARIRERYGGRWICGLCAEAVKDEICGTRRLITMDEAISRHVAFCGRFRCGTGEDPAARLIAAVRQLLRRSLDSPRGARLRSTPSSPRKGEDEDEEEAGARRRSLARSGSCFPSLGG